MKRAALFIGVNRYEDSEINPLQFAESDTTKRYILSNNGLVITMCLFSCLHFMTRSSR